MLYDERPYFKKKKKSYKKIVFIIILIAIAFFLYKFIKNDFSFWNNKYAFIEEKLKKAEKLVDIAEKRKILANAEKKALEIFNKNKTDYLICSYLGDIYSAIAKIEKNKEIKDNLKDKAIIYYRRAIAFDRSNLISGVVHYRLGLEYFNKGPYYYYDAMLQLETALKLGYENKNVHKVLGIIYLTKGEADAARKELEMTVIQESDYKMRYFLATAYKNGRQYQKAIKIYKDIVKDSGDRELIYKSYIGLGWLYYRLYLTDKAISMYKKALEIDDSDAFVYYWIGKVYLRKKQKKNAKYYLHLALKKDKNYSDAKRLLNKLK